ncbi:hypothetical protein OEZ85_004173 [Tetradesmus obliquus]|uniref:Uncharacterized protein n=1 Tax=Tetradesmus obliquus TaxID=3088 RepID=A0ABY8UJT2_TETOB|nr:hypothetical protein OEZ85_004173 [Tetradesmus obliquus]
MAGAAAGGGAMGLEDAEHAHMLTALRQPLFIQAPLQAMLEAMLDKLQLQAAAVSGLQDKVSTLQRSQLDASQLLERVRLLEARLGSIAAAPLSPFSQAELLQRVADLEGRATAAESAAQLLKFSVDEGLEQRLALAEGRLAGVHNLAGRLMVVDAVAAELGIPVPQLQLASITQLGGMQAAAAAAGSTLAAHAPGIPAAGAGACGVLTRSKQQELQQQIDAGKAAAVRMQQQLDDLQQQVQAMRGDAASAQDSSLGMLAGLADQQQALAERLDVGLAQLRKEMKPSQQQTQQVSLSDFSALQSKVEAATAATTAAAKELAAVKSKELPALSQSLAELSRKLGRGPSASVSEVDRLLAGQLGLLQQQLAGLAGRLDAREAAELEGQGVATREELQELSALMSSKASRDDMRAVLGRAVGLALEAYRGSMGDRDASGASRTRCLVCDRSLMDRSVSPPHTAPAAAGMGRSSSPLPLLDQFRPATAAAGCSSGAHIGPLGPGLNAAQLRRMAEARLQGGSVSSSLEHDAVFAAEAAGSCSGLGEGIGAAAGQGAAASPGYHMPASRGAMHSAGRQQQQQQQQQQRPQTTGGITAGHMHGHVAAGTAGGSRPSTSSTRKAQQAGQQQARGVTSGRRTPVFV